MGERFLPMHILLILILIVPITTCSRLPSPDAAPFTTDEAKYPNFWSGGIHADVTAAGTSNVFYRGANHLLTYIASHLQSVVKSRVHLRLEEMKEALVLQVLTDEMQGVISKAFDINVPLASVRRRAELNSFDKAKSFTRSISTSMHQKLVSIEEKLQWWVAERIKLLVDTTLMPTAEYALTQCALRAISKYFSLANDHAHVYNRFDPIDVQRPGRLHRRALYIPSYFHPWLARHADGLADAISREVLQAMPSLLRYVGDKAGKTLAQDVTNELQRLFLASEKYTPTRDLPVTSHRGSSRVQSSVSSLRFESVVPSGPMPAHDASIGLRHRSGSTGFGHRARTTYAPGMFDRVETQAPKHPNVIASELFIFIQKRIEALVEGLADRYVNTAVAGAAEGMPKVLRGELRYELGLEAEPFLRVNPRQ